MSDNCAVLVAPPKTPEMVTDVRAATDWVATVNPALVAPGATVAVAGTVATEALLLDSDMTAPRGAALVKVIVP